MRAAVISQAGAPEVLTLETRPVPQPGPFEIRVRVEASALNRADLLQRRGLYPAPIGVVPDIPGLELAGTVEALGPHTSRFKVGDQVMAIVGGGACAEMAVLHEREAMRTPSGITSLDAAAIPEAFMTAWDAAMRQGGLSSGQWVAVTAVGSGVGSALVQLARAYGARSLGSTRTAQKLDKAAALGLTVGVEGTAEALIAAAKEHTDGGVAVAVDLVGGPGLNSLLRCVRRQGSLVLVGLVGGRKTELDLGRVLRHRLQLRGTVLRSRPIEEKIALARAFEDQVIPRFEGEQAALSPVIDRRFGLSEIAAAHAYMESNANFGKIVLDHAR